MMWKDILKIDMEEARRLGERYAPEDMEQARSDKLKAFFTKIKPAIEKTLEMYEMTQGDEASKFRDAIVSLIRDFPNPPRLIRSTTPEAIKSNKEMVEKYLVDLEKMYGDSPRKTTSLIDRAKEMNRKHPRMGSGRK